MKKSLLETIENVEIYPMISFAIFGLFFLVTGFYVLKMSKKMVDKMGSLPLETDPENDKQSHL